MIYSYNTIKDELRTFTAEIKGSERTICGYYTRERVHPDSVPEGMFMYECRHSDSVMFGQPISVEPKVTANFAGTVFTNHELTFPEGKDAYIPLKNVSIVKRKAG